MLTKRYHDLLLWAVYLAIGAALVVMSIVFLGCGGGVEMERGVEFRQAGVYYQTDADSHALYAGASGDLVLSIGTFTVGIGERFNIDPDGLFSQTEVILRLEETVEKGQGDVYFDIKVALVLNPEADRSDICFDVEVGGFGVPTICQPLLRFESEEQFISGNSEDE